MKNNYFVALYIRLSREDGDKENFSESITNQKSLLLQYIKENNLNLYDIYIDDGYSGTNFERPAFRKMIKDIENKKINMVITKDMSRLGRDYIKTGELVEKYFPEHSVRYISVTDNIDTYLDSTNNDIAPFKAIMNDFYAKDISKKIRSSLKAKMKDGKFVGCRCPFGYDKDPNDKNHLIVNINQAKIVKKIFNMALNGDTCFKIAKKLTEENIKTPASYYNFKWKNNYNINYSKWNSKTIKDILTNKIYIGDLVQNKRSKVNYKVKKVIKNNSKDYIIVKNTHEAIIDKETFFEVEKLLPKNVGRKEKKEIHLLDGLMYCGDCGHRISVTPRRKKNNRCYTICNYYRAYIKEKLCTTHCNNYEKIENIVINKLKEECKKNINQEEIKKHVLNNIINNYNGNNKKKIECLFSEITKLNQQLDEIYLDKLEKNISLEQFIRIKEKLNNTLKIKKEEYKELNIKIDNSKYNNKLITKYINNFFCMNNISREMVISLIDKIEIYEDKHLNIKFCFNKE